MGAFLRFLGVIFTALASGAAFGTALAFCSVAVYAVTAWIFRMMGLVPEPGDTSIYFSLWPDGPSEKLGDELHEFYQFRNSRNGEVFEAEA